ncbi:hypothetical protein [Serinicoccus marinus]|nr:hypothetical protein [Serinicoccus marinus]
MVLAGPDGMPRSGSKGIVSSTVARAVDGGAPGLPVPRRITVISAS